MSALYVFIGGGIGSLLRFGISKATLQFVKSDFPIATVVTNILACALLAILVIFLHDKQNDYPWAQPLLLAGFCGGFSTFSTFGLETVNLINSGNHVYAILNVLISVVVGIGLIYFLQTRS